MTDVNSNEETTFNGSSTSGIDVAENTEGVEYKNHEITIKETENEIRVEVVIKGKEYGLIFKKGQREEAIKIAKQTIDYISPKESAVIEYKNSKIYVIKLKDKYIAKGLYKAFGAGKILLEESGKTKKEVIKNIKKSFQEIERVSNNIKNKEIENKLK